MLLAIETSQRDGSVALLTPDGTVLVEPIPAWTRHDGDLVPAIDRVVAKAGARPSDLEAVGVSIGPGGFTGLRIAVSVVKMMAFSLGVDVYALPTALTVAEALSASSEETQEGPIIVALASKGETFWSTTLAREGKPWQITGDPGLCDAGGLVLEGIRVVVGDRYLPENVRDRCDAAGVPVVEPTFCAAACLEVTRRLRRDGPTTDPLALAPLYPRKPEAVRLWDARERS